MNAEVEFLDFKPSEIAAAAAIAIYFSGEAEAVHNEKALSRLIHVKQVWSKHISLELYLLHDI